MRSSRKFLTFIIVLLVINTLFFLAWYAFDAQGRVKGLVEREAGKALKGKMRIGSFTISDQQVFAEKISFAAADSSLNFTVDNARVRYNLLRYLFTGLKLRNLLDHVEIDKADVRLILLPKAKKKTPQKFKLPDLKPLFNNLVITHSRFRADASVPLKLGEEGILRAIEELNRVELSIINTDVSHLDLSAVSAEGGSLKAKGVLDRGLLVSSQVELQNYRPLYLGHPRITDFSGTLDLVANASQKAVGATPDLSARLTLRDASALVLDQYQLQIQRLDLNTDGDRLNARIAQAKVGSSSLSGDVHARGVLDQPVLDPSQLELRLDLSLLGPQFSGLVDGTLYAEGPLSAPVLDLVAGAERISFDKQSFQNIALAASYDAEQVELTLSDAVWQNQRVSLTGTFDTQTRKLAGVLRTTPVSLAAAEMKLAGSADLELDFQTPLPQITARIHDLSFAQNDLNYHGLSGTANLVPLITDQAQNFLVDVSLNSPLGIDLNVVGDINSKDYYFEADLQAVEVARAFPSQDTRRYEPLVSGRVSAFLSGSKAVLSSALGLDLRKGLNLNADLSLVGSYDLKAKQGDLVLDIPSGKLNGQDLALELVGRINDQVLQISSLNLNDQLLASGNLNLRDLQDTQFQVALADISSAQVTAFFPRLQLPEITGVNLTASYSSQDSDKLDAVLSIGEVRIPGLKPLSARLTLLGDQQQVDVRGAISNETKKLVDLAGDALLQQGWNLRLNALTENLNMADLMYSPLAEGAISGNLGFFVSDVLNSQREMSFDARLSSTGLKLPEVADFDDVLVSLAQTKELLIVDTLYVHSPEFGFVKGSGALDYNLLSQSIYEGEHTLNLQAEGLLFAWLDKKYDYVQEASGSTSLVCSIRTRDDELLVQSGRLLVDGGRMVLADQPEVIRNIAVDAEILNNQVSINTLTAQMGNGVLHAKNQFDSDPASRLKIAMLDLGTLLFKVDEPGALLYIPDITTPRSRSRISLRGQNSEWAKVTGPFEDLKVTAEGLVSDASIVYPPKTNNLLNLIYSFRGTIVREPLPESEPLILPFSLDLMVIVQDNVKYATYPTNFVLRPDGYMHILFDGQTWLPQEASITSEQGSMDFFGTKFSAESLDFSISGAQKLVLLEGVLTHETADGTIITLNVSTDKENPRQSILKRVKFTLDSDNPDDVSIANMLGRMRYNAGSEQLSTTQRDNLLQDEALSLISENLDTSILSPILYPLENNLRRWLRLDDFSIRAGFIQNLFTAYSTDPNQLANYADMGQFMGNVSQFSSSILLNNLSIHLSKYLGRRFFLDYTLSLQEATDLQNRTEIVVSHDTSLRWFMPYQFRLAYTFKFEPTTDNLSHELMLQRSFKFWGL